MWKLCTLSSGDNLMWQSFSKVFFSVSELRVSRVLMYHVKWSFLTDKWHLFKIFYWISETTEPAFPKIHQFFISSIQINFKSFFKSFKSDLAFSKKLNCHFWHYLPRTSKRVGPAFVINQSVNSIKNVLKRPNENTYYAYIFEFAENTNEKCLY